MNVGISPLCVLGSCGGMLWFFKLSLDRALTLKQQLRRILFGHGISAKVKV